MSSHPLKWSNWLILLDKGWCYRPRHNCFQTAFRPTCLFRFRPSETSLLSLQLLLRRNFVADNIFPEANFILWSTQEPGDRLLVPIESYLLRVSIWHPEMKALIDAYGGHGPVLPWQTISLSLKGPAAKQLWFTSVWWCSLVRLLLS